MLQGPSKSPHPAMVTEWSKTLVKIQVAIGPLHTVNTYSDHKSAILLVKELNQILFLLKLYQIYTEIKSVQISHYPLASKASREVANLT